MVDVEDGELELLRTSALQQLAQPGPSKRLVRPGLKPQGYLGSLASLASLYPCSIRKIGWGWM